MSSTIAPHATIAPCVGSTLPEKCPNFLRFLVSAGTFPTAADRPSRTRDGHKGANDLAGDVFDR